MNKKLVVLLSVVIFSISPAMALGDIFPPFQPGGNWNIPAVVDTVLGFVYGIFSAFAVFMFLWAGFMFLTANGDPGKTKTARMAVVGGIIGVGVAILAFTFPLLIRRLLGV